MEKKNLIQVFDNRKVRTAWDEEDEKWYFSVVDVVSILTESADGRKYWNKLKQRLKEEGNETVTNCHQLKFATLTDIITQSWSGKTTKEYKQYKGLKKESLRDNMTNTELILNMLAEVSTKDISQSEDPITFEDNMDVAKRGGKVAGIAREQLEIETGRKVVTPVNAKNLLDQKTDGLE